MVYQSFSSELEKLGFGKANAAAAIFTDRVLAEGFKSESTPELIARLRAIKRRMRASRALGMVGGAALGGAIGGRPLDPKTIAKERLTDVGIHNRRLRSGVSLGTKALFAGGGFAGFINRNSAFAGVLIEKELARRAKSK